MTQYDPRVYWSRVGLEIRRRGGSYLAGDDNPLLRYKRSKFLREFLDGVDFRARVVLEVGCGPGGNLLHIAERHDPARLVGVDIAAAMRELAADNLRRYGDLVEILETDGRTLPLGDRSVDLAFTVTVLQHVTDAGMFGALVREICRVARDEIVIMEDIGTTREAGGQGSWVGRTVETYRGAFAAHGFRLGSVRFLGTAVSRRWYHPVFQIYRHFINRRHREGDAIPPLLRLVIGGPFPLTRRLDRIVRDRRDLAQMVFRRG
jgi:SAM-dependent methyltransferase